MKGWATCICATIIIPTVTSVARCDFDFHANAINNPHRANDKSCTTQVAYKSRFNSIGKRAREIATPKENG